MYRQGNLDSLCGVYAVINSVKAVASTSGCRLTRGECKELFRQLCQVLADGGRLEDALTDGTTIRTFQAMTRRAHDWLAAERRVVLGSRRAFGRAPGGLDHFWTRLQNHAVKEGPGSILIGIGGRMDHMSCIRSINDRAILLVDSDGVKFLRRDRCTVSAPDRRRIHQLFGTQTLLVSHDAAASR